jgi:hypothetical protein
MRALYIEVLATAPATRNHKRVALTRLLAEAMSDAPDGFAER